MLRQAGYAYPKHENPALWVRSSRLDDAIGNPETYSVSEIKKKLIEQVKEMRMKVNKTLDERIKLINSFK